MANELPGHTGQNALLFIEDDLLASTEASEQIDIVIATAARDAGHPEASTHLRRGLVMSKITASGKYSQFLSTNGDGTEVSAEIVILGYEVRDIDLGDKSAMAYFAGTFHSAKLVIPAGAAATWADVQRIQRR